MAGEPSDLPHELVIIRRRSADGAEAHKGGVWKIAYADFMTAMMAFFLVMWLINAANEATRAQVASYFNPVKLIDSRTNVKGLQDLDTGADGPARQRPPGESQQDKSEGLPLDAPKTENSEESLFKDPYVVLAELAKEAGAGPDTDKRKTGVLPEATGRPGLRGGEGFIDPFDPASWRAVSKAPVESPVQVAKEEAALTKEIEAVRAAGKAANGEKPVEAAVKVAPTEPRKNAAEVEKLKQDIERVASEVGAGRAPLVEVKSTEEGVLVSLTDASNFGMFEIASAKPNPETVRFMEKVARVLSSRPGRIVIRGHTDGRPFRGEGYDNWRLSAARAHMAYYMLVRGGIDEKRVERIEGHADRNLKVSGNPEADENRRIEILVRETKP